ncbi:MAG: lysozyme [Oxalobacter formigenes]|nr:lysozyme [Oxalobacter formigenes]
MSIKKRVAVAALAMSAAAAAYLTIPGEGLRLSTYTDPAGVPTIGYGHTGDDVKPDMTITRKQAENLLWNDLHRHGEAIKPYINVPMAQEEWDALNDFVFNVGVARARQSTMLKKLNAGDYDGFCNGYTAWVYAKGKKLKGLVTRREKTVLWCKGKALPQLAGKTS